MLRAEVYAHAMRASQNRKKGSAYREGSIVLSTLSKVETVHEQRRLLFLSFAFFLSHPEGGLDLVTIRRLPNRRLQSPPGRTGSLARGSYNFRKRSLRRSRCEHGGVCLKNFSATPRNFYDFHNTIL